jgi:hypothetical protein
MSTPKLPPVHSLPVDAPGAMTPEDWARVRGPIGEADRQEPWLRAEASETPPEAVSRFNAAGWMVLAIYVVLNFAVVVVWWLA